jgi:hypothetical protein
MSVKALSRFGAQVIAMYKQMAGSSIGALGPLELSLALKRAGISMPLCICSTLPLRMRLARGLCPAHEVLYVVVVGTHTRVISHGILGTWQAIPGALGSAGRLQADESQRTGRGRLFVSRFLGVLLALPACLGIEISTVATSIKEGLLFAVGSHARRHCHLRPEASLTLALTLAPPLLLAGPSFLLFN